MKRTLSVVAAVVLTAGLVTVVHAGGSDCSGKSARAAKAGCDVQKTSVATGGCVKGDSQQASAAKGTSCPSTAGQQAYAKAKADGGCEATAKKASQWAMAEAAYTTALVETGCEQSAARAAYEVVMKETGCGGTAEAAYRHAVGQAAYTASMKANGCSKSAQEAYDKAASSAPEVKLASADAVTTTTAG